MTIREAKQVTRISRWRRLIHEWQQNGQSMRAWCMQNGIRESSYYCWLRIIREEILCETESRSGALVSVESGKLAVETVLPRSPAGGS